MLLSAIGKSTEGKDYVLMWIDSLVTVAVVWRDCRVDWKRDGAVETVSSYGSDLLVSILMVFSVNQHIQSLFCLLLTLEHF